MSRVSWDGADAASEGLWQGWLQRAMFSKRGQVRLRAIEAALLALPEPKLAAGYMVHDGMCCTVAAVLRHQAVQQGIAHDQWMASYEAHAEDDNLSIYEIASAGQAHGLTWALSWELVMLNDETFGMVTPEYRYEAVLAWVRRRIDGGPGNGSANS